MRQRPASARRGSFLVDAVLALLVLTVCGFPLATECVRRFESRSRRLRLATERARIVEEVRAFQLRPTPEASWALVHDEWELAVAPGESVELPSGDVPAAVEWRETESGDEWILFVHGRIAVRGRIAARGHVDARRPPAVTP